MYVHVQIDICTCVLEWIYVYTKNCLCLAMYTERNAQMFSEINILLYVSVFVY